MTTIGMEHQEDVGFSGTSSISSHDSVRRRRRSAAGATFHDNVVRVVTAKRVHLFLLNIAALRAAFASKKNEEIDAQLSMSVSDR